MAHEKMDCLGGHAGGGVTKVAFCCEKFWRYNSVFSIKNLSNQNYFRKEGFQRKILHKRFCDRSF